jgi:hypothetical protein
MTDWNRWRKCETCGARIGEPCTRLTGTVINGRALDAAEVPIDEPHRRRKPRAGVKERT